MRPTHQSEHHVFGYKAEPPAPKCRRDLRLMVFAATTLHGRCVARRIGSPWDAVTFVPSLRRPGREHPVAQLSSQVVSEQQPVTRFLLCPGSGATEVDSTRFPRGDGFTVAPDDRERVAERHVLVVEDTWVSGATAQSAAITLKDAGATAVTVLAVARWLRNDWPDHRMVIDGLTEPYDALVCPVTGAACPQ